MPVDLFGFIKIYGCISVFIGFSLADSAEIFLMGIKSSIKRRSSVKGLGSPEIDVKKKPKSL